MHYAVKVGTKSVILDELYGLQPIEQISTTNDIDTRGK